MSSNKENLRNAEAKPDPVINFSYNELWRELYQDIPIELQPGEKTIPMMINELDRKCEHGTMTIQVKKWVAEGKLVFVGIRVAGGKLAKAYKAV